MSINFQQSIFSLDQKEREYLAFKSQVEEEIANHISNLLHKEEECNSLQSKFEASTNALKKQEEVQSSEGNESEALITARDEVSELKTRNIELSSNLQQARASLDQKESEYLTLCSQMEEEIANNKSHLLHKEEEYSLLQSKFEALTNALKEQEDAKSMGGDIDELRSKIALLEKFHSESKSQIGALQADLIVARKRLKVKDHKENDLKAKMNESQKQMMVMAKSLNETCEELVAAGKQLEELKGASDAKIEGMQLAMQKMNQKLQNYDYQLQAAKSQLQEKDSDEASLRGKVIGFERKIQDMDENLHLRTMDVIALKDSLNESQAKLRVYEELGDKSSKKKKKKAVFV